MRPARRPLARGRRQGAEGSALVITILVGSIILAAGLFLLASADMELKAGDRVRSAERAFYLAEAGLARSLPGLVDDYRHDVLGGLANAVIVAGPGAGPAGWTQDGAGTVTGTRGAWYLTPDPAFPSLTWQPVGDDVPWAHSESEDGQTSLELRHVTDDSEGLPAFRRDAVFVRATGVAFPGILSRQATRTVEALVRLQDVSVWSNVLFAGAGTGETPVQGNFQMFGSVHVGGDEGAPDAVVADLSGNVGVFNVLTGLDAVLTSRIPAPELGPDGPTLHAVFRVRHGRVLLSGSASLGALDDPDGDGKELLDGVFVGGTISDLSNVHADEVSAPDGYDIPARFAKRLDFPLLTSEEQPCTDPLTDVEYPSYEDCLVGLSEEEPGVLGLDLGPCADLLVLNRTTGFATCVSANRAELVTLNTSSPNPAGTTLSVFADTGTAVVVLLKELPGPDAATVPHDDAPDADNSAYFAAVSGGVNADNVLHALIWVPMLAQDVPAAGKTGPWRPTTAQLNAQVDRVQARAPNVDDIPTDVGSSGRIRDLDLDEPPGSPVKPHARLVLHGLIVAADVMALGGRDSDNNSKRTPILYDGRGTFLVSASNPDTSTFEINENLLPLHEFPCDDALGIMAEEGRLGHGNPQVRLAAALYAQELMLVSRQTQLAGAMVADAVVVDSGSGTPKYAHVGVLPACLPPYMIASERLIIPRIVSWNEP